MPLFVKIIPLIYVILGDGQKQTYALSILVPHSA